MSIVKSLAHTMFETIKTELGMQELGSAQNPYKILRSPMATEPVGCARIFTGHKGEQLVYIGLAVPQIQLDSHMVFCFSGANSLLPHFTVDAVQAGDHYAFHLDLIPRIDLAVNLSYMQTAYQPLSAQFKAAKKIDGLSEADLSPTQFAVMSPWMLAYRATEPAMDSVGMVCSLYLNHWLNLYRSLAKLSEGVTEQNLALRDKIHRSILFSREIDPVWLQVERLIGQASSEELRSLLTGTAGVQ